MFAKLTSFVTATLVVSGVAMFAVAAPASDSGTLQGRKTELSPDVQVCTGNVGTGCVTIPVSSGSCINFTGGLSFLNKEVSSAVIPDGLVCTFYEQFSCESNQGGADAVVLQGGTWNFLSVPGTASTVNFNDLSSSFICSPL